MVEALAKRTYSLEEYFEQELASKEHHEFLDGEIWPMTGRTPNHNQIALNLSGALNYHLLTDQLSMHVKHYRKTGENAWVLSEYDGVEAVLRLAAFEFEMMLGDLYNKVVFEAG